MEFLPREAGLICFVNADLIADGLSPLRPELAARQAGRLVLIELTRLAKARKDFAIESKLSGRTYLRLLRRGRAAGCQINIVLLSLFSAQLTLQRIAAVLQHEFGKADMISLARTCLGVA
jgi:predicted ABC-type ATPase